MKLSVLSVVLACQVFTFASIGICQEKEPQSDRPTLVHTQAPRLYFLMPPTERIGRVELAASDAQLTLSPKASLTSAEIESVLQLRGNVQVEICAPSSHGCDKWSILLRADAVDYNEQTREMDARGDVHIEPNGSLVPRQ
jgi:lipopolysaccharide assembly outer membrane protein LptD (OstA)